MKSTTHPIEPEEVMAYLDGELAAERAAAVGAHLEQCAECAAVAAHLRGVSSRMAEWQVEAAPEAMKDVVTAAERQNAKPERVKSSWRRLVFGLPQWAWGLAGSAAVVLLFAAISLPNLLRARITANETSAVGSMRAIGSACAQFLSTYGGYPRALEQLGPGNPPSEEAADLIDGVLASGTKSGYQFMYAPSTTDGSGKVRQYVVTAEPLEFGKSGSRSFFADQSGVIRMSEEGVASLASQPLSEDGPLGFDGLVGKNMAAISALEAQQARAPVGGKTVGPMIIRSASLAIVTREFDDVRATIEKLLREHGGYAAQLNVSSQPGRGRTLKSTVRVPSSKVDVVLEELKKLGRVVQESQSGDEITQEYVDLVARQENGRHIEQRLVEVLRTRAGKVNEVLEVEKEIARVREEIERMEAKRKSLTERVEYATVSLELREEFEKKIGVAPPSTGTLLWNAMADGLEGAFESVLALALFLLRAGPSLLLWAALLFLPARSVWRRMRAATAQ
jgi:hypothetical protein